MPPHVLAPGVLSFLPAGRDVPVFKALGRRPILDQGADLGPPPAAEQRAETVFETTGIILVLLIVLGAAWILIRRRV
ncbi:hypothetical protein [Microvirga sp. TS319]|uniref:hypothetical protein n=1 Tax=Microvirga sp. TS319 TaxID=3241165 RepID=UPI00351A0087